MQLNENSQRHRRSEKLGDGLGRPRIRPLTESIALGFKAAPDLVQALDQEAARLTAERGPGASKVSRTEVIKLVLAKWLADRSKPCA
jgi:hypothetical protein